MNLLYPKIAWRLLPSMLAYAAFGALIAGSYGMIHDQVTYSISREYFTQLKFIQFHYADFGLPRRLFVAEIGFLATWWVGFFAGWFMARITVPTLSPKAALRLVVTGFLTMFGCALAGGATGFQLAMLFDVDLDSGWRMLATILGVHDTAAFVRVAYIHNGGYIGGAIGLILDLVVLRRMSPLGTPSNRDNAQLPRL